MRTMAVRARGAQARRQVHGLQPPDVSELALNELTGIAERACGCFELKDTVSGSWIRFRECNAHGRRSPDPRRALSRTVSRVRVAALGEELEGTGLEARIPVE